MEKFVLIGCMILLLASGCVEKRFQFGLYNINDPKRQALIDREVLGFTDSDAKSWANAYSIVYPICKTELHNLVVHAFVRDSADCVGDPVNKLRLDIFEYRFPDGASTQDSLADREHRDSYQYVMISSKYREKWVDTTGNVVPASYKGPILIFHGTLDYRDSSIIITKVYTYRPYKKNKRKQLKVAENTYRFHIASKDNSGLAIDRITVLSENKYGARYGAVYNLNEILPDSRGLYLESIHNLPIP
jgi:hypothetical protein